MTSSSKKTLVSLSGGMDSTTLIATEQAGGKKVTALFFSYPSKHNIYERIASERIAHYYSLELIDIDVSDMFSFSNSSLIDPDVTVPRGHYEDPKMKSTIIPGRNLIFISVMARVAWEYEIGSTVIGVQKGDHAIYPDCRPEFIENMKKAVFAGTGGKVNLRAPFMNMTKEQIVKQGLLHKVPYEITRTCYQPQMDPCGKCGACVERAEAFAKHKVDDPVFSK